MKAITRNQYGSPDVLELKEIDEPVPKNDELLIRVYTTTVNRTDCGILRGKPFPIRFFTGLLKPSTLVPGTDFAGKVVGIGGAVKDFKVGDRVWGLDDEGLSSHAEYMVIRESRGVAHMPENIAYEEVVACGEGAHYAYNFVNKVAFTAGDKVLVNGATGAIGSAALQILKSMEVYVTAVGNTKNLALLKSLGADKVYNYETEEFTEVDDEKYNFVFDAVGKSTFGKCKKMLLPNGVYISSELGPNAENLYLPLLTKFKGDKRVIFPIPQDCRKSILYISDLIREGKFRPVIDRRYQPEEIREAYRYVESGQKTGNVIVRFGE